MPAYTVTPSTGGTVTVNGVRPFTKNQTGGDAGAVEIHDANGKVTNPAIDGQAATSVYAESAGNAVVDAIVLAANNSPVVTAAPTAPTGTAQVGQVLTAHDGTASGTPAPTASRQWYANGVAIAGAVGATYNPVAGNVGKTITTKTTWTNTAGVIVSVASAATAAVIA